MLIRAVLLSCLIISACAPVTDETTEIAPVAEYAEATPARPDVETLKADYAMSLQAARSTSGAGAPPVWMVSDEDTDIYLFGTVHVLRPGTVWRSPAFDAAFARADRLVLEIDATSEAAQDAFINDFVQRGTYQDGRTLRQVLSRSDAAIIETAVVRYGLSLDMLDQFKPWLVMVNLSSLAVQDEGFEQAVGLEAYLYEQALAQGKSIGALEAISDQAEAFDRISEAEQIELLYETALMLDEMPEMLDDLVAEWRDGDVAGIAAMISSPSAVGLGPEAYDSLLVQRNRSWVTGIEAMLDEAGVVFVAVGAGHLAGPDSLAAMLRARGHVVEGP